MAAQGLGDYRLPDPDKDRSLCVGQTASGAWAGTAQRE